MSFTLLSLLMPSENPTPPTKCTFFSSAASICQLKTVSGDVCTGLQGLRKQERISRLQIGPGPSRVARAFYRTVATALTCLSDSCTFPVHILINGCGSRKWNYFKFYKKGLWSLSNSSCYRRGKKIILNYFYVRGELLPAQH